MAWSVDTEDIYNFMAWSIDTENISALHAFGSLERLFSKFDSSNILL